MPRIDYPLGVPPGVYRAGDRTVKVLYSRGGLVHFWEVADLATANDAVGKLKAEMTLEAFEDAGFEKVGG
jgi:hypothetical protein